MGILAVAGQAFSAFASAQSGNDTGAALDAKARSLRQNAAQAMQAARMDAYKQSLMSAKVQGAAQAAYGASGVSSNSGSVIGVLAASAANAELDRQNILYGGAIRELAFQNEATQDNINANHARTAGRDKAIGFGIGAGADAYKGST